MTKFLLVQPGVPDTHIWRDNGADSGLPQNPFDISQDWKDLGIP